MKPDDSDLWRTTTIHPSGAGGGGGSPSGASEIADPQSIPMSIGFLPSLPVPLASPPPATNNDPLALVAGQQIEDFHIVATLGRGGFGAVYLAWQVSLSRQIALKIAPSIGQEGRTLARLDHPHIVRVYSESLRQGMRLLCMQYVPSAALDDLLDRLAEKKDSWTGADVLSAIDASLPVAAEFDPEQLADRQKLSELDHADAVCWIVSRLADALAHAHRHDVVHRDLKPGNVLISQYGRPMLVDFNLANILKDEGLDSHVFGGTLPYMAPEHLDAYNPEDPTQPDAVTQKADLYSLGVILYELFKGRPPFPPVPKRESPGETLRHMAELRRHPGGLWEDPVLMGEPAIRAALQRSLAPNPADRWESASEMAQALAHVSEMRRTLREVERRSPFSSWFRHHPFITLALVGLVPHLLGSLFNIPYNLTKIVREEQQPAFFQLANYYNVLIYPACIWLCFSLVRPVFRHWIRREERFDDSAATTQIRDRLIDFPIWTARIALIGWLPGMVFFPLGLHILAGPLTWQDVAHFQLSILLSGLIALTYSSLGVLCLTVSVFYPALWVDPRQFRAQAEKEVRRFRFLLRTIPLLAGAIPLIGAILLIGASPDAESRANNVKFRILTVGLIMMGMIGYQIALAATTQAVRAVNAFRGRFTTDD